MLRIPLPEVARATPIDGFALALPEKPRGGEGEEYESLGRRGAMSVVSTHGVNEPTVLEEREGGHCQLRFTNEE